MTPAIVALAAAACIAALGACYRYKKISHLPFGTGFGIDSPDGRSRAHAADYCDESLWGRKTRFYGFEVTEREMGRTIARHETPRVPAHEMLDSDVDFYSEMLVSWTPDSRRVRVEFRGRTLWEYDLSNAA